MTAMNADWVEHPGAYIREEMEERGWLQRDLAFILGAPQQAVNMILTGKRGISADMAIALGAAFDVAPKFFANLQQAYDLAQAKNPYSGVEERRRMQTIFPVREMIQRGWIQDADAVMLETQLVRLFEAESAGDVPYLAHAAKKTGDYEQREIKPAQLAWLFRVRQIAKNITVPPYSETALKKALSDLEVLMTEAEQARQVPRILAECGVRYVLVEKLPNTEIDGVCFWLDNNSPVIGMSLMRDRIDNFWFVLRHEIEHVLRKHGRDQEIIDVNVEADQDVSDEEKVANAAAQAFCVPQDKMNSFMARKHPFYYEKDVVAFARLWNRHPGIVIGQMRKRLERWTYLTRYLVKVRTHVQPGAIVDGWGHVMDLSL